MIGKGVAYRKTDEMDLCWSAMVENGVLFIGRGVAYRKTGLHGILFISTVDPSSLHELLFIHRQPPPASTGYIFARKEVPDSRDPPGRSVCSVVILVANVYVDIYWWM